MRYSETLVILIVLVLLPSSFGLICHSGGHLESEIADQDVVANKTCKSGWVCSLATLKGQNLDKPDILYIHDCTEMHECPGDVCANANLTFHNNQILGSFTNFKQTSCSSRCCTTNLCNHPLAPPPTTPLPETSHTSGGAALTHRRNEIHLLMFILSIVINLLAIHFIY